MKKRKPTTIHQYPQIPQDIKKRLDKLLDNINDAGRQHWYASPNRETYVYDFGCFASSQDKKTYAFFHVGLTVIDEENHGNREHHLVNVLTSVACPMSLSNWHNQFWDAVELAVIDKGPDLIMIAENYARFIMSRHMAKELHA